MGAGALHSTDLGSLGLGREAQPRVEGHRVDGPQGDLVDIADARVVEGNAK